jgi:hypothetical protein
VMSQSTYFQLSTSRLGSLEIDEVQRPKSEELRPGWYFQDQGYGLCLKVLKIQILE